MNVTLVCEDNIEGIMTAIYDGWVYMNKGYSVNIHPGSDYAPTFFSKFINIETDNSKAERVIRSIKIKISEEAYIAVFRTCMNFAGSAPEFFRSARSLTDGKAEAFRPISACKTPRG